MPKAKPKTANVPAKRKGVPKAGPGLPVSQAGLAAAKLPEGVKAVRVVTLPSLSIKNIGQSETLQIFDEIRVSKVKDTSEQKRAPANICTVAKIPTGEQFVFIVPKVVQANLERDYPADDAQKTYVGRAFHITNMGKRKEDQRYNDYSIIEVEPA